MVVQLQQQEEYLEYIELQGKNFDICAYDGEVLVSLVTAKEALRLWEPPLEPTDLEGLHYLSGQTNYLLTDRMKEVIKMLDVVAEVVARALLKIPGLVV